LIIFRDLLGWNQQKYFVDAIQFGSVIAVILYFWSDIRTVLTGAWTAFKTKDWLREEWKLFVGIAVGSLPALIAGYLMRDNIPESALVIGLMSMGMGLLLGAAEQIGSRQRKFDSLQVRDGLIVGLGQMLAIIPGVSRSGSTITTALFLGLERQTAARFAFLLGIPTLAIATLYQSRKAFSNIENVIVLLAGIASAFLFSYLSIAWLLRYLQRQSTWVFVWYRLALGAALILAVVLGKFPEP
jgi:undecaprenyl-diphosphatase